MIKKLAASLLSAAALAAPFAGTAHASEQPFYHCPLSTVPPGVYVEVGGAWFGNGQPGNLQRLFGSTYLYEWATADATCTVWTPHYIIGDGDTDAARAAGFPG